MAKIGEEVCLDTMQEAVKQGGYPYRLERTSRGVELHVEVAPGKVTSMCFAPDGSPLPPQDAKMLLEMAAGAAKVVTDPVQESIESVSYNVRRYGACTDEDPCRGLQTLMKSSCPEHGGIMGVVMRQEDAMPQVVGFVPPPGRRQGQLLAFNFCPCCGKEFVSHREFVLGVTGPTMLQ